MGSHGDYDALIPLRDFLPAMKSGNTSYKYVPRRLFIRQTDFSALRESTPSDAPIAPHRVSIDSSGSIRINEDGKSSSQSVRREPVIGRDRSTAIRYFLQFHIIPLAVAATLIVINIQSRFLGIDTQWTNLLQFIAKLHEILMQISITTAMIGYQQYLLTQSNSAVPFGAIFSAYHATQVGYLWSSEFRASVTTPRFPMLLKTGFVLFVAGSILLASGVGPASAIAMLPRLVSYRIANYRLGLDHAYGDVFPMALTQPGALLEDSIFKCKSDQRILAACRTRKRMANLVIEANEQSPAIGWEYLRGLPSVGPDRSTLVGIQSVNQDLGNGYAKSVYEMPPLYSVDLPTITPHAETRSETFTRTLYVQYAPNSTVATVQQAPVAAGLSMAAVRSLGEVDYRATTGEARIQIAHPFVSSICVLNAIMNENDTRALKFPAAFLASNDATEVDTVTYINITRQQLWAQMLDQGQGQIIWVDDVSFSVDRTLGAIVVQSGLCDNGQKYLSASTCAVSGLWANMTSRMTVTSLINASTTMFDNRAETLVSSDFLNTLPTTLWQADAVALSKEWANSITSQISNQNRTVADNLLRSLLLTENVCPVNGSYTLNSANLLSSRPMMHEALVSALVANGMSHATGPFEMSDSSLQSGDFQWTNANGDKIKPAGLILTFQSSVVGYAWTMDGTAIKIAVPILIIYCLYVISYVTYTLVTGHSSRAWDTIASLTALAFNSRPSKVLENTSVRISRTETFRSLVSVQEVESERRLEMVFQPDEQNRGGSLRRVRAGKAYS
ncbi:hypothetical protein PMAA_073960 [Talaromyces marneffei ATCC 18224]|uniref:Uncharacterized protein n=1 Tax=Talaromyces marneffei (strain ATCC 18224 / CBS 334.59 / QM 7333) TaxID=441960 RepID=B6QAU3_TALMQ|nr:hypothetical protein PMAA_073960 [Talaromyces marneffei ATCC 18224]